MLWLYIVSWISSSMHISMHNSNVHDESKEKTLALSKRRDLCAHIEVEKGQTFS